MTMPEQTDVCIYPFDVCGVNVGHTALEEIFSMSMPSGWCVGLQVNKSLASVFTSGSCSPGCASSLSCFSMVFIFGHISIIARVGEVAASGVALLPITKLFESVLTNLGLAPRTENQPHILDYKFLALIH